MNTHFVVWGHTYDAEGGSKRLHTGQLARLAVVDWVGCNQIWQQPWMGSNHSVEGSLFELGPGTINDCQSTLSHYFSGDEENMFRI